MIPRFTNPAILEKSTRIISRAQIHDSDSDENGDNAINDPPLLKRLQELIENSLGDFPSHSLSDSYRKKRRKVQETEDGERESVPIAFRLVSSSLAPQEIQLMPKPPPPTKSIEPEYEDDELQAEQRKRQAYSVAVNADWVIQESRKLYPVAAKAHNNIRHVKAPHPLSIPPPAILITEGSKSNRHLRPLVPTFQLPSPSPHNPNSIERSDRPLIPIRCAEDSQCPRLGRSRSRPRRRASAIKQRPQSTYWRHDPAVKGKSLGYALGYPGNWTAYDSAQGMIRYERDTMQKGIHIDAL